MSARRVRIFIDFWNFQLSWNAAMGQTRCDWRKLPAALLQETGKVLMAVAITDPLDLEETLLYASVDPIKDGPLRGWLTSTIDRMPSWKVTVLERRPQKKQLYCSHCKVTTDSCPSCGELYMGKPEKGVDSTIVTDLLSLAWQDAYDIAILVSSDADFIPAVNKVQTAGLKVINAAWAGRGHHLKTASWGSFDLNGVAGTITRP